VAELESEPSAEGTTSVQVKLFAPFRYQAGMGDCSMQFRQSSVTVGELLIALHKRWPRLATPAEETLSQENLRGILVIVNGKPRNGGFGLRDGDEVSILSPVSGG
jgi:molybdopterin converting factor small subunit